MRNIAIMGFKCSGKTMLAKALAERLSKEFIDLDDLIVAIHEREKGEKLSFREIHKKYGADYFRKLEKKAVEELEGKQDCVIALGGGTIAYNDSGERLKKHCIMVYLKESPEELLKRIKCNGIPAFLDADDLEESMKRELDRREPFYEKYADIEIQGNCLNASELLEKLLEKLESVEK